MHPLPPPPCTPYPGPPAVLAAAQEQCQDDALFPSMRQPASGAGGVAEIWIFAPLFAASK